MFSEMELKYLKFYTRRAFEKIFKILKIFDYANPALV